MLVLLDDRSGAASRASRTHQLHSSDHFTAAIALITFCVGEATAFIMAPTFDHTIGQGRIAALAEELRDDVLVGVSGSFKVIENVVCDFSLLGC